jgi:hypothetical protein
MEEGRGKREEKDSRIRAAVCRFVPLPSEAVFHLPSGLMTGVEIK